MENLPDYEKLGSFYLGKKYELAGRRLLDEKVLYDAKDLTTHAMCVGMTGSGKTGLCLSLLEEAAIDGHLLLPFASTLRGIWETFYFPFPIYLRAISNPGSNPPRPAEKG